MWLGCNTARVRFFEAWRHCHELSTMLKGVARLTLLKILLHLSFAGVPVHFFVSMIMKDEYVFKISLLLSQKSKVFRFEKLSEPNRMKIFN